MLLVYMHLLDLSLIHILKDSDLEKGNVIQRYKKAADERQLQMEGSSTLAFAEKDALMRNGIDEKDKKEFFANYLSMETEYLVAVSYTHLSRKRIMKAPRYTMQWPLTSTKSLRM